MYYHIYSYRGKGKRKYCHYATKLSFIFSVTSVGVWNLDLEKIKVEIVPGRVDVETTIRIIYPVCDRGSAIHRRHAYFITLGLDDADAKRALMSDSGACGSASTAVESASLFHM